VSQPCDKQCDVPLPGELDSDLNEFWVGNPWDIFREHNLSSFERNRTYMNAQGNGFLEVTYSSGADTDADSRCVMALDLVQPGKLDLVLRQSGGGPLQILKNDFPDAHYLKISLRGTESNRLGLGAKLIAYVGDRQIVREMYPVNSYRSQCPSVVHFGLGQATQVDKLKIVWPSGLQQEISEVPADRHLLIEEGTDTFRDFAEPKLKRAIAS